MGIGMCHHARPASKVTYAPPSLPRMRWPASWGSNHRAWWSPCTRDSDTGEKVWAPSVLLSRGAELTNSYYLSVGASSIYLMLIWGIDNGCLIVITTV